VLELDSLVDFLDSLADYCLHSHLEKVVIDFHGLIVDFVRIVVDLIDFLVGFDFFDFFLVYFLVVL